MVLYLLIYALILSISTLLIMILDVKWKGFLTVLAVILNALLSAGVAGFSLAGHSLAASFRGTEVTGSITLQADALSGWFLLVIQFSMVTGALYGLHYMGAYRDRKHSLTFHGIAYLILQASLTFLCMVRHSILFLILWETMTLSAVLLVIFDHKRQDIIRAGINFLVQSHLSIVFLTLAFLWIYSRTHSFDFNRITDFTAGYTQLINLALFLLFFAGFAFKAGFVPFHTWLPHAHPAAPSHISGVMSGVMLKIGIYGILRMLLLIKTDYTVLGYFLLIISAITGVYGVMLAIIQHNLKKLLAYHSIENIGIIGLGIGVGAIGIGAGNPLVITLGFAGCLMHVLNHSLFKSLLFYGAGNVFQSTHTLNVGHLGGLIRRMPHTSFLFLIGSMAICGLPPFNGFISEFLIYSGLFNSLSLKNSAELLGILTAIFSLALIGGLALYCFGKVFSIVFLGQARSRPEEPVREASWGKLWPMYLILLPIVSIGLFPNLYFSLLTGPVNLFLGLQPEFQGTGAQPVIFMPVLKYVGLASAVFLILAALIYLIRNRFRSGVPEKISATWGCGYTGGTARMQYTAGSFSRNFRKLAEPVLSVHSREEGTRGIFPESGSHTTHSGDKMEEWLIDRPLAGIRYLFSKLRFLQNGNPQYYILYGVVFITLVITLPMISGLIKALLELLNRI